MKSLEILETKERPATTYSLYWKGGYAHFILMHELGIVHAQTDYGDYSYRWSNIGDQTLEQFLCDIDSYYCGIKFCGRAKTLDEKLTLKKMKQDIFLERRENNITKEIARECYDSLRDLDFESVDRFYFSLHNGYDYSSVLTDHIYQDYSSTVCVLTYSPCQKEFINRIFPAFQQYLKDRLNGNIDSLEEDKNE